jgi:uncharacterized membrane protein
MLALWPTWLSYAVSYVFIAVVWTNHHHLLRYATEASPRLIWFNFGHLFAVSLLPVATAWMAVSRLGPQPVSFYAVVFFLVNVTYALLIWELVEPHAAHGGPANVRRKMRVRSIATLCLFGIATKFLVAPTRPSSPTSDPSARRGSPGCSSPRTPPPSTRPAPSRRS